MTDGRTLISSRDFLVMLVRAQLGRVDERDEEVIDALMTWGLDTIRVTAETSGIHGQLVRLYIEKPRDAKPAYADMWTMGWYPQVGARLTLAEIFTEMHGRRGRTTECPKHGPQRGMCCAEGRQKYPLEQIEDGDVNS